MSPAPRKTQVAVLGGGAGGLTAAFELTATPELRAKYDVTVYQLGWRLGGKGASGRNADYRQRIEEHGLHIWFGFYDNAFTLMQRCYEELGRPAGTPLATWDEAFFPCNRIVLYEEWGDRWVPRDFTIPKNPLTPGDYHPLNYWELIVDSLEMLRTAWDELATRFLDTPTGIPSLRKLLRRGDSRVLQYAQRQVEEHLRGLPPFGLELLVPPALDRFRNSIWEAVVEDHVDDDEVRLFFMVYDMVAAIISGILRDRLLERGFGVINDEELTAWLRRHGATDLTLRHSPFLRGFYSLIFGFEAGDPARPNVAAGKALQALIKIACGYKGAILWKMRAGMGDAVFAPLYEVLRRRGVKFRFFHAVTELGLSRDRRNVSRIVVQPQVELARGRQEYSPLVDVKGLPCWPSEPKWREIKGGAALKRQGFDLEHAINPCRLPPVVLRQGHEFDVAVLAIPVGALRPICKQLMADEHNPRFRQMIEHSATVATQAFQLWIDRPIEELGWEHGPDTVLSSYVEPVDTYCDMAHLIDVEGWAHDQVGGIGYFCGVLPDAVADDLTEARAAARNFALDYLDQHIQKLWPGAMGVMGGFEWKLLVDEQDRSGEARFDSQYCRANFSGTERYVTTPPGSVAYRLKADESGYRNLVLAGDWICNGIDGGSVEAAVTSGMQASRAVCGQPKFIPGEDGILERD